MKTQPFPGLSHLKNEEHDVWQKVFLSCLKNVFGVTFFCHKKSAFVENLKDWLTIDKFNSSNDYIWIILLTQMQQGHSRQMLYHTWYFHSLRQSVLGAKIFRSFFTWSAPPLFILDLVLQSDAPPPHILDPLLWSDQAIFLCT